MQDIRVSEGDIALYVTGKQLRGCHIQVRSASGNHLCYSTLPRLSMMGGRELFVGIVRNERLQAVVLLDRSALGELTQKP